MNKLQKRAWIDLAGMTVCLVIASAGVGLMVYLNANGIVSLMAFLIGGSIVGLISCLHNIPIWVKFDEREKKIALKAFVFSSYTFILFYAFSSFIVFFIAGGKGHMPAYTLPVLFLVGLFLSQFVQSAAILIQFAREQADEQ